MTEINEPKMTPNGEIKIIKNQKYKVYNFFDYLQKNYSEIDSSCVTLFGFLNDKKRNKPWVIELKDLDKDVKFLKASIGITSENLSFDTKPDKIKRGIKYIDGLIKEEIEHLNKNGMFYMPIFSEKCIKEFIDTSKTSLPDIDINNLHVVKHITKNSSIITETELQEDIDLMKQYVDEDLFEFYHLSVQNLVKILHGSIKKLHNSQEKIQQKTKQNILEEFDHNKKEPTEEDLETIRWGERIANRYRFRQ